MVVATWRRRSLIWIGGIGSYQGRNMSRWQVLHLYAHSILLSESQSRSHGSRRISAVSQFLIYCRGPHYHLFLMITRLPPICCIRYAYSALQWQLLFSTVATWLVEWPWEVAWYARPESRARTVAGVHAWANPPPPVAYYCWRFAFSVAV